MGDDDIAYIESLLSQSKPSWPFASCTGPAVEAAPSDSPTCALAPTSGQGINNSNALGFINQCMFPPTSSEPNAPHLASKFPLPLSTLPSAVTENVSHSWSTYPRQPQPPRTISSIANSLDYRSVRENDGSASNAGCRNPLNPNWEAIDAFLAGQVRSTVVGGRVFRCAFCGVQFPNGHSLGGHMSSHSKNSRPRSHRPAHRRAFKQARRTRSAR